jgi:hypothetical protein
MRCNKFSIYLVLPAALGPGVHSASNRNKYLKHTNNVFGGQGRHLSLPGNLEGGGKSQFYFFKDVSLPTSKERCLQL